MTDYTIRLEYNPKPIPDRKCDWDASLADDPEFGTEHGSTAWDALHSMAYRLEMEAEESARPECPVCHEPKYGDPCSSCEARRSDRYIASWCESLAEIGREATNFSILHATCDALDLIACESMLEQAR